MRKLLLSVLVVAGLAWIGSTIAEAGPARVGESTSVETQGPAFSVRHHLVASLEYPREQQ